MTAILLLAALAALGWWAMTRNQTGSTLGIGTSLSITDFARAIQTFEGFFPGTRSYRNNNPGNLKYVGQPGTTGQDDKGFAVFGTYEQGWAALIALIQLRISQHPTWTILDFFMSYAPPSDNNPTQQYAQTVANVIGASTDTQIGQLTS